MYRLAVSPSGAVLISNSTVPVRVVSIASAGWIVRYADRAPEQENELFGDAETETGAHGGLRAGIVAADVRIENR